MKAETVSTTTWVALDGKRRGDQRRAGAAHGGDLRHQRIAVADGHPPRTVGDFRFASRISSSTYSSFSSAFQP